MKSDKEIWSDLAVTITRKIGNAMAKLELENATPNAGMFVVHMSSTNGSTGAVMQVISETVVNTSVNFAGDPETVKIFATETAAHLFMQRFHLAYYVGPLKAYLEQYIATHNETVAMLKKHCE